MSGVMDGLSLLREISRRWPGTGLILISGFSAPPASEMPPGAQYLLKPVSRRSLDQALTMVRPSMNRQDVRRAAYDT